MSFNSVFNASKTQPVGARYAANFFSIANDPVPPQAILAFGGILQCLISLLLPPKYAFVPFLATFLFTVMDIAVRSFSGSPNQYMHKVIPGAVSAQIPDHATGKFDSEPASTGLVVLHVGARCNHPLGPLAPGFKEFADYFQAMNDDIKARADELGLYSITSWMGNETSTTNAIMNIYYFRDMQCVNRFAQGGLHRKAWSWYNKGEYPHIGTFHEVFDVPAQSWETIYANMQPTLLGDSAIPCTNKENDETVWINPLVDANTPALRGMFRRMGRKPPTLAAVAKNGKE